MMKSMTTTIVALLMSLGVLLSCRTLAHADSTLMGETKNHSHLSSQDCEVWRFYLFNTLANIIYQSKLHETTILYNRLLKIDRNAKHPDTPPIHKLLPAYKARKMIDTVLDLEKGVCSRKLLYETPCRALPTGGKRKGGIIHNHSYDGHYKDKYFSDVMGIPMNNLLAIKYERFLLNHLSKSPESNVEFNFFGCRDIHGDYICNRETVNLQSYINFSISNNAGLCLLMKHQDYLKENDFLDLRSYYTGRIYTNQLIAEDLEAFIQKSYEIQESYGLKDSDNK